MKELRRAVRLAPNWTDTYYWLGAMLDMFAPVAQNKAAIARESIQALQRAEKMNPAFHYDCLLTYVDDYNVLKRPDVVLKYLNAYIKSHPNCAAYLVRWRDYLLRQHPRAK